MVFTIIVKISGGFVYQAIADAKFDINIKISLEVEVFSSWGGKDFLSTLSYR